VALAYFVSRRRAVLPYWWVPALFAMFIFLCGTTHVMNIWTVWYLDYVADGLIKLATGSPRRQQRCWFSPRCRRHWNCGHRLSCNVSGRQRRSCWRSTHACVMKSRPGHGTETALRDSEARLI